MLPCSIFLEICKILGFCLPPTDQHDRDIIGDDSVKFEIGKKIRQVADPIKLSLVRASVSEKSAIFILFDPFFVY